MRVLKKLAHRGPSRPPVVLAIITILYLVWSLAPIITAMVFSFNHGPGVNVLDGFTTKWWIGKRSALMRSATQDAIIQTFTLAIPATLIAVPLGAGIAVGVDRWRSRTSSATSAVMILAFATQEIVLGVMFYLLITSVSRGLLNDVGWFGTKVQILALATLQISPRLHRRAGWNASRRSVARRDGNGPRCVPDRGGPSRLATTARSVPVGSVGCRFRSLA